ncbi:MAG: ABC transporter permease [Arthrobacter sp.]|uniref:ABC transporter permease n=1 Tax=Arthrobacter sp. TaxID=1667 RepID=UPI0034890E39
MEWLSRNWDRVLELSGAHLYQSVVPLVLATLISIPLARAVRSNGSRRRVALRGAVTQASALLYTIPSLALFVVLPVILGTQILDPVNVIVALTIYAVALLVRSAADALESVDPDVLRAADAMGYRPLRRFFAVDLPLSLPVLFPALRVVSVSNISLVSVGALIGIENLGTLFMDGLRRNFPFQILVGIAATLVLALVMDLALVALQRLTTPWVRAGRAARGGRVRRPGGIRAGGGGAGPSVPAGQALAAGAGSTPVSAPVSGTAAGASPDGGVR